MTYLTLSFALNATISTLIWPSFMCHFATFATDRIASVGEAAYDLNWYDFPVEFQKFTILMIARSQKPAEFTGLNLIRCSMPIFASVSL